MIGLNKARQTVSEQFTAYYARCERMLDKVWYKQGHLEVLSQAMNKYAEIKASMLKQGLIDVIDPEHNVFGQVSLNREVLSLTWLDSELIAYDWQSLVIYSVVDRSFAKLSISYLNRVTPSKVDEVHETLTFYELREGLMKQTKGG